MNFSNEGLEFFIKFGSLVSANQYLSIYYMRSCVPRAHGADVVMEEISLAANELSQGWTLQTSVGLMPLTASCKDSVPVKAVEMNTFLCLIMTRE